MGLFKKKYFEVTLVKNEYSFPFTITKLLNNLPQNNLPVIIECYNYDLKEKVEQISIFEVSHCNHTTCYFGSNNIQQIDLETEVVSNYMLKFDVIEISFANMYIDKIMNKISFCEFVDKKDIKFFSDLFIRIDNQHEYVLFKWRVDFKFDFLNYIENLRDLFVIDRMEI